MRAFGELEALMAQPGAQPIPQQLCDVRARDDDAPVDVEKLVRQPGFAQQIGNRNALADATPQQALHTAAFGRFDGSIGRRIEGQAESAQHQKRGFVVRVRGAMPVVQPRRPQTARGVADQLAQDQGSSARSVSR